LVEIFVFEILKPEFAMGITAKFWSGPIPVNFRIHQDMKWRRILPQPHPPLLLCDDMWL
jgi:hypothetical protein